MNRTAVLAGITWCIFTATATADLMIDEDQGLLLDVSHWTGEGENASYLVLDFEATGGESHALGYRWDDTATVMDMLGAFSADLGLVVAVTTHDGFGTFVDNFSWGTETGDPSLYWTHSMASPDGSGEVSWSDAVNGVDVEELSDGLISGWYNGFNEDYSAIPPSLPLTTIPAPGVLTVLGMIACPRSRRRFR